MSWYDDLLNTPPSDSKYFLPIIGKIRMQMAKLSRVIRNDERSTADKRKEIAKRFVFWMIWVLVTGGVLLGIWEIGYCKYKIIDYP